MKARLIAALLVGAVLGFGMTVLAKPPEAKAQKEAAPIKMQPHEYEFKVTRFPYNSTDAEKQMTELAAKRWEYVGVIFSGDHGSASLIAFRRPKK
jgi:hypothetical protein